MTEEHRKKIEQEARKRYSLISDVVERNVFAEGAEFGYTTALSESKQMKWTDGDMKKSWQEGIKAVRMNAHRDGSEFNFFEEFLASLPQVPQPNQQGCEESIKYPKDEEEHYPGRMGHDPTYG